MLAVILASSCVADSAELSATTQGDRTDRMMRPAIMASRFLGPWRIESSIAFDFAPSVRDPGINNYVEVVFSESPNSSALVITHYLMEVPSWTTVISEGATLRAITDGGLMRGEARSVMMDERSIVMLSAVEGNWIVHSYRTVGDDVLEYCVLRLLEPMGGTPMMRRVYRRG